MAAQRCLIVMADDFGIGMPTSNGILDLAGQGLVTAAVLLVNSPFAEEAVHAWRQRGSKLELGWHPCLTLDRPISPPAKVPSLVGPDGCFHSLGGFLSRLFLGFIRAAEIRTEFAAQEQRFRELVGHWPTFLNGHQHVHAFASVGAVLTDLLSRHRPLPYVRRVSETWPMLARVPGARCKRAFLSVMGRRAARVFDGAGYPSNEYLAGITNPVCVTDPAYLTRWLTRIPGQVVELACHPGYLDSSLLGRDCQANDGLLQRRVNELHLLKDPAFVRTCRETGLRLVSPGEFAGRSAGESSGAVA